jgi:hypothetical protein
MAKSADRQDTEHVLARLQENLPAAERSIFERLVAKENEKKPKPKKE